MLDGRVILVTGATGRLGTDVTARLEGLGAIVIPAVLDGYPDAPLRVPWAARTRPVRIGSADDLASIPSPDIVVNLHWRMPREGSVGSCVVGQLDANIVRPGFLWDWLCSRPGCRFVNVSTAKVYAPSSTPVSPSTEPRPATPYGIAKLAAEHALDAIFAGTEVTVDHARLGSAYAYGEHPSKVVTRLAASGFDAEPIQLRVDHHVHLLYVDEAVDRLIAIAAGRGGGSRRLVVGERVRIGDLASAFESAAGRRLETVTELPGTHGEEPEFIADAQEALPWVRVTSLHDGLVKFVSQRHEAHSRRTTER